MIFASRGGVCIPMSDDIPEKKKKKKKKNRADCRHSLRRRRRRTSRPPSFPRWPPRGVICFCPRRARLTRSWDSRRTRRTRHATSSPVRVKQQRKNCIFFYSGSTVTHNLPLHGDILPFPSFFSWIFPTLHLMNTFGSSLCMNRMRTPSLPLCDIFLYLFFFFFFLSQIFANIINCQHPQLAKASAARVRVLHPRVADRQNTRRGPATSLERAHRTCIVSFMREPENLHSP
jgi:hypothetical protein